MGVRVKFQVDDQVTEQLRKLGEKSPAMLDSVLFGTSLEGKKVVKGSMRRVLHERTGKMLKGVKFNKNRKHSFKLKGPNLGSVYEYKGAEIFPKEPGGLLKWKNENGQWMSSNWVSIKPRPFFYSSMRNFLESGEVNRVMNKQIDEAIKREKIKL